MIAASTTALNRMTVRTAMAALNFMAYPFFMLEPCSPMGARVGWLLFKYSREGMIDFHLNYAAPPPMNVLKPY
jgi:hypothetical protein